MKNIGRKDLKKLMEKDEETLKKVYDEYVDNVGRYLNCNGVRSCDLSEIICEIFYQLLEKIKYYDPERGTFEGYIMMLARFELINYFRKQNKREASYEYLDETSPYWGYTFNTYNLVSILKEMGTRLSPLEHDVLLCTYIYHQDIKYICKNLNITFYMYHKLFDVARLKVLDYLDYYGYDQNILS